MDKIQEFKLEDAKKHLVEDIIKMGNMAKDSRTIENGFSAYERHNSKFSIIFKNGEDIGRYNFISEHNKKVTFYFLASYSIGKVFARRNRTFSLSCNDIELLKKELVDNHKNDKYVKLFLIYIDVDEYKKICEDIYYTKYINYENFEIWKIQHTGFNEYRKLIGEICEMVKLVEFNKDSYKTIMKILIRELKEIRRLMDICCEEKIDEQYRFLNKCNIKILSTVKELNIMI